MDITELATLLDESFYSQETPLVAQQLLGSYLTYNSPDGRKIGRITETEAYPGIADKASHSSRGMTPRTKVLFGPAGIVYVYLIYGMYYCLNIVTHTPESGGAVLLRAVEPIAGLDSKTTGPGLLCKAYGITTALNGTSAINGPVQIYKPLAQQTFEYTASPRIGVDYAGEDKALLYRYTLKSA